MGGRKLKSFRRKPKELLGDTAASSPSSGKGKEESGEATPRRAKSFSQRVSSLIKSDKLRCPIEDISIGFQFGAFCDKEGRLFSFGVNTHGQLGIKKKEDKDKPKRVKKLAPFEIKRVSCGISHMAIIDSQGRLYTCGSNVFGELGRRDCTRWLPKQVKSLQHSRVVWVACGYCFTIAVTDRGDVLAWGRNRFGQLGNGTTESSLTPTKVKGVEGHHIIGASASEDYAILWDEHGICFSVGNGPNGQLGLGPEVKHTSIAMRMKGLGGFRIANVSCAPWHCIACDHGGRCFTWGKGEWGALGHDDLVTDLFHPKQIPDIEGVKSVAAGDFHSVIVTTDGTPYVMGDGKFNQLGTTGKEWKKMKRKLPISKPLDITSHAPDDLVGACAGQACTFLHDENGELFFAGTFGPIWKTAVRDVIFQGRKNKFAVFYEP